MPSILVLQVYAELTPETDSRVAVQFKQFRIGRHPLPSLHSQRVTTVCMLGCFGLSKSHTLHMPTKQDELQVA